MTRLRLVTGNPHKVAELRRALPGWDVEALAVPEEPVEDGAGYLENAWLKALHGRPHAGPGDWVVGEDSGIEADALGGRPGIASARWAADGVARLLAELGDRSDRGARYVCALVAVGPHGEEVHATGTLEGSIGHKRRGSEGFGYDPVFVPAGETRTVAELGDAWKSVHSHRARAARVLAETLAALKHPARSCR